MQLSCPGCYTLFQVDPAALGGGRQVRCTRCGTRWFAEPVIASLEPVAVAAASMHSSALPAVVASPRVIPWDETIVVDVADSPPLSPSETKSDQSSRTSQRLVRQEPEDPQRTAKIARRRAHLFAISVILVAALVLAIGLRTTLVRLVPDLAGLYSAIGMPVNLRGLEFRDVRTKREMQDGIPVLVIEGDILNVTRKPVELPRLRLAVLGADNRELYAWTALLPRAVLPDGERIGFRSRLASPPPESREVLVRFLNRHDLSAGMR